jgi:Fic family protein
MGSDAATPPQGGAVNQFSSTNSLDAAQAATMRAYTDSMNPDLLKSIEGKKRELDTFRPFSPELVRKLDEQFTVEWTYNSNAIEGNTLTLQETDLVINRGLTIGNKSLKEHFEAINHKEGIQYL